MDKFPNLYIIVTSKGICITSDLNKIHLNVSFKRALLGENLMPWLELVSRVANVSLGAFVFITTSGERFGRPFMLHLVWHLQKI